MKIINVSGFYSFYLHINSSINFLISPRLKNIIINIEYIIIYNMKKN